MMKNMLDLANAMNWEETANAGAETAIVTNTALREIRDGMVLMQQQMNQQGQQLTGNMQKPFKQLDINNNNNNNNKGFSSS